MNKKKVIWGFVSLGIAVLTVRVIAAGSKDFSWNSMMDYLAHANKLWILGALLLMFGYIWFEGMAVVHIARTLGYRSTKMQGTVYGAADVFFSAITPSASGGQPASAFFMLRDGMSLPACTTALLINLVMYTLATLTIGSVSMVFHFDLFQKMSVVSKALIIIGWFIMIGLSFGFYMLLRKSEILHRLLDRIMDWLEKRKFLSNLTKKKEKLKKKMEEYQQCSDEIAGHGKMLVNIFILNLLQRISQIGVTFMIFMSLGKGLRMSFAGFVIQAFTALGSNSIPIPGGMGGADYLMLDGFGKILGHDAASVEMLCRSCSFYLCIVTSAVIVLVGYFVGKNVRKKRGVE